MEILRTPDECFDSLPDWPYAPRYTEVAADPTVLDGPQLRVAHIDEGPPDAAPVLLLHGEPTWGYLYRHIVPLLVEAGHRVVVPDLVGFGRSDKPADRDDYTYARHVSWMNQWLLANDLTGITLFCQDWGGLIGLRLVAAHPERFANVVAGNTFLPTGDGTASEGFMRWLEFSQSVPTFPVGVIVNGGCATKPLSPEVIAAYDAPFPEERFKAGARQFPTLVPISPEDPEAPANRAAWEVLEQWHKPFLCAFSDQDRITAGNERGFLSRIPGCTGQPHVTIHGGGHFLQEDRPAEVAAAIQSVLAG